MCFQSLKMTTSMICREIPKYMLHKKQVHNMWRLYVMQWTIEHSLWWKLRARLSKKKKSRAATWWQKAQCDIRFLLDVWDFLSRMASHDVLLVYARIGLDFRTPILIALFLCCVCVLLFQTTNVYMERQHSVAYISYIYTCLNS